MIEYAEDVNGSEVEWTLGAAISEIHPAAKAQASGPGGDAAEFEQTCDIRSSFATVTGVFKKMLAIGFVAIGLFSLYSARAVSNIVVREQFFLVREFIVASMILITYIIRFKEVQECACTIYKLF